MITYDNPFRQGRYVTYSTMPTTYTVSEKTAVTYKGFIIYRNDGGWLDLTKNGLLLSQLNDLQGAKDAADEIDAGVYMYGSQENIKAVAL